MGDTRAPSGVSVEFSEGQEPKPEDDTKEIVTPKAVQYKTARTLTTSRLVLVKDDGAETSYPLTRDTYTVGRHRNNDIVVSDPKVSSFHARFDRTLEGFVLVDLRSRNGSFVNGRRVDAQVLQSGDEVRLGTAKLRYRMD
jgi:pSer/pThr/pTyr-binding forkhead associated (FHA) protein